MTHWSSAWLTSAAAVRLALGPKSPLFDSGQRDLADPVDDLPRADDALPALGER
jgi:hypothetical protein